MTNTNAVNAHGNNVVEAYKLQTGDVIRVGGDHYTVQAVTMAGLDHVIVHCEFARGFNIRNEQWVVVVN